MSLPIDQQQKQSQNSLYPLPRILPDYGVEIRWVTTDEVSEELIKKTNDLFLASKQKKYVDNAITTDS